MAKNKKLDYKISNLYRIEIHGHEAIKKFSKWTSEQKMFPSFTAYGSSVKLIQLWSSADIGKIEAWLKQND